jgi:hypothetical protein
MAGTDAKEIALCTSCGTTVSGNYCSGCGAPAEDTPSEGWSGVAGQFLTKPQRDGVLAVAFSFLRRPVSTILRLTDDPSYRSHWRFLSVCLGAQLTLAYVILPRLYALLFNLPDKADNGAVITNEVVQYVGMAILTPVQYYLCRALGSIRRTPMSYVKLCVLSVSFCTLVAILLSLIIFAIGLVAVKGGVPMDMQTAWTTLTTAAMVVILAFVTESHRKFWGMRWWVALAATLMIAVLSWSVVYPGLATLAEKSGIPATLGRLLG